MPKARYILYSCLAILLLQGCVGEYIREAEALEQAGDYEAAIEAWDKVVARDPRNIEAYLNRGIDKGITGDRAGAIEDLSRVITMEPEYIMAWYFRGIEKYNAGDYEDSLDDLNRAIEIKSGSANPNVTVEYYGDRDGVSYADIVLERAHTYYALDSIEQAFKDFNTCFYRNHELLECSYFRGFIYYNHGQKEEALEDFRRVIRLGEPGDHYYDHVLETLQNNY